MADRHGVTLRYRLVHPQDQRPAAVYGDYEAGERTMRLLMPLTMMNASGDAFRALKVDTTDDVLIVCDDVNLPLGTLRLRPGGGAGGHRGLESCLEALGTEQVPRLRLGVGAAAMPSDLRDYVLSPFTGAERPQAAAMAASAADACEVWVKEGIDVAMNRYNRAQGD